MGWINGSATASQQQHILEEETLSLGSFQTHQAETSRYSKAQGEGVSSHYRTEII